MAPDEKDNWEDDRTDWIRNEVATGYNAALVGALAKMYAEFGGEPSAEISFPEPSGEPEIYVEPYVTAAKGNTSQVNLTIVNKSATPARGLENPKVRVFYLLKSQPQDISVAAVSNDCPNISSQVVKVKNDLYYIEVDCDGTVIYPGGDENYKKQMTLKLDVNDGNGGLFSMFNKMFGKPAKITKICLFDGNELVWESDSLDL